MKREQRPLTVLEWTTLTLREELLSGELRHGEPLKQDEISSRLGVSRMPVREAIRTLAAEGLVIERPNRKAIVAPLFADDALELFQIRAELECLAVRLSLRGLSSKQREHISRAHEKLVISPERDYPARHLEFHNALYAGAGPRLKALIEQHIKLAERYLRVERSRLQVTEEDREEHEALLNAAMAGDTELAVEILHPHIAEGGRAIAELFSRKDTDR